MELIDKATLIAEIEDKINILERNSGYTGIFGVSQLDAYENMKKFIDTLEVKEVDLEKELFIYWNKVYKLEETYPFNKYNWHYISNNILLDIIKYFYELGLKTKQPSEDIKIGETQIYLDDDGEPPYDGKQWLDLSCTEYEIPNDKFKDGDNVEIIIRKV